MPSFVRATTLVLMMMAAVPAAALAGGANDRAVRPAATPVKDCTRMNGRVGYYGNPWCTPAEQAIWDKWEARRFRK